MNEVLDKLARELEVCGEVLVNISKEINKHLGREENTQMEFGEQLETPSAKTLEEVRGVLMEKARLGFTDKIREILLSFGADKLSDLDAKHYDKLLQKVEDIT